MATQNLISVIGSIVKVVKKGNAPAKYDVRDDTGQIVKLDMWVNNNNPKGMELYSILTEGETYNFSCYEKPNGLDPQKVDKYITAAYKIEQPVQQQIPETTYDQFDRDMKVDKQKATDYIDVVGQTMATLDNTGFSIVSQVAGKITSELLDKSGFLTGMQPSEIAVHFDQLHHSVIKSMLCTHSPDQWIKDGEGDD
jgi:hypothetical protein